VTAEAAGEPHPAGDGGWPAAGRRVGWAARVLVVPVLVLLAACTADPQTTETASTPSPFADCAGLTSTSGASAKLPGLELPCFTGGTAVKLTGLPGPAVINLWASWCAPCRAELPAMQQLADRAAGKVTVLGVDTFDGREAAASFAADSKVTLPTLFDPDKKLIGALGYTNLPVTIFLAGNGAAHVEALPLDDSKLDDLVKRWTGVTVTP
jgi:cytochrome c biogenesis protein CcmG/thiol:disulfide interchange protein DsbE